MKESGYLPTFSIFTELIEHVLRSNQYKRACKLYREMLENGVELDIVAFTALITGHVQHNHEFCKAARTNKDLELLNKMRISKMNISDEMFHLEIASSERKGDIKTAEKVKQIWRAICNQENGSKRLLGNFIRAKYVPDKELVEIYLNCLCQVGKVSDAQKCKEDLCKSGFSKPLSYSLAIGLFAFYSWFTRAGKVDEALNERGRYRSDSPCIYTVSCPLLQEETNWEALEFFNKMVEDGCEPTIVTFSALIRGYMNMEMVSDAWIIFRCMKLKDLYLILKHIQCP
ncbi:hypothetical protein C5167_034141 [Papaver somniferum]|uniref:Pentacotripeptide-repeat region of PRORP domain-containing protein n=1 Tax=Papaver somniferum TaxID=3469 RepID=A0A4Y7K922_PAPSO|nr:hypothetical protein C5167_034141 [Papaver somniferum]